jgi:hypothetical protein
MLVRAFMFCAVLHCAVLYCFVLYYSMPARASIRTPHVYCWLNRREISCIAFWEDCFVWCYSVLCCAVLYCAVLWCIVAWALQPISPRSIYNLPLRCRLMLFYTEIYCPEVSCYVLIYSLLYRCIVVDISRHLSGR